MRCVRRVSKRLRRVVVVACVRGESECLCTCEMLCERSIGMSLICMVIGLGITLGLARRSGVW